MPAPGDCREPPIATVPLQWSAPEVCAGTADGGAPATTASDVYMVGVLAYELLTGGTPPFHWLAADVQVVEAVTLGKRHVPFPGLRGGLPGLQSKSVLEVAEEDGEPIPWCVRAEGTPGGSGRLEELKTLLAQCLSVEPEARPKLLALLAAFRDLLRRQEEEERASGLGGAGGSSSPPASPGPLSSAPLQSLTPSALPPAVASPGPPSPETSCVGALIRLGAVVAVSSSCCSDTPGPMRVRRYRGAKCQLQARRRAGCLGCRGRQRGPSRRRGEGPVWVSGNRWG